MSILRTASTRPFARLAFQRRYASGHSGDPGAVMSPMRIVMAVGGLAGLAAFYYYVPFGGSPHAAGTAKKWHDERQLREEKEGFAVHKQSAEERATELEYAKSRVAK